MGVCREFGPQIHPDCDHPMRAGVDSCTCAICGTRCTGQFPACPQVWLRSTAAVGVGAPAIPQAPAVVDDTLPDLPTPTYEAEPRPRSRRRWTRRQFRRVAAAGALIFLGALIVYATVATGGGERADELSLTDRATPTTQPTATTTAAPPTTPVATTLAAPPPTAAAPSPPTAAPPAPPRAARAAPRPAPSPAPRPTTRPARGPVVRSFPPMCGFVPGSPVDVEVNGRSAGTQTADARGCVSRPPR